MKKNKFFKLSLLFEYLKKKNATKKIFLFIFDFLATQISQIDENFQVERILYYYSAFYEKKKELKKKKRQQNNQNIYIYILRRAI